LRFSFYSLRTRILTHLAFLILSAMLLINVVMVKLAEKDLVAARARAGRLLVHAVGQKAIDSGLSARGALFLPGPGSRFTRDVRRLLHVAGFSGCIVLDRDGVRLFRCGDREKAGGEGLSAVRSTLARKRSSVDFFGNTWGVIWFGPRWMEVSAPLRVDGRTAGGVTVRADLIPLYCSMRKSEKIVLLYVVLNTGVLVLFGLHLLSRVVVRPIYRLLRITEEFKEGETLSSLSDFSPNEIGRLSRSLQLMLKRLEENKAELKSHILSLERANREIKNAQEEILRSEKLASVGRLAAGVAHEIGNPIGIILGYLDLLKGGDVEAEQTRDLLERIESEVTRVNRIIRQLLDFSRPATGTPVETGVHDLILETAGMLEPQPMMARIEVRPVLEASEDRVWTDPSQLKQVFLNIMLNAADAMAGEGAPEDRKGGTLTITTRNRGNAIEVRFRDTGRGIPASELEHIFDPFYTTKEPGKGTGLGLAVCYRIVDAMGGTIRAESAPGEGTVIVIDIPLHAPENGPAVNDRVVRAEKQGK